MLFIAGILQGNCKRYVVSGGLALQQEGEVEGRMLEAVRNRVRMSGGQGRLHTPTSHVSLVSP